MKQIPLALLETYKKSGRSTCFLVKIVSRDDGSVFAFTTADHVITFDDGGGVVQYWPNQEMRPQNIQSSVTMDVDNTELHGWFDAVVEQAVLAGKFNSAEITIYRVAYFKLSLGCELVAYGQVGRIEYAANANGKRKIEYRGLDALIRQKQNDLYSLTCRNDFGDEKCGMPFVWEDAVIDEVEDNRQRFRVTGVARPDDWFTLGVVMFDTGDNTGSDLEIESWTDDGWVTLSFVTPYAIVVGVGVSLRQDCDKTATSCKNYGNIINMNAEHLTPVQDQSLMVPGAYIKSSNAL